MTICRTLDWCSNMIVLHINISAQNSNFSRWMSFQADEQLRLTGRITVDDQIIGGFLGRLLPLRWPGFDRHTLPPFPVWLPFALSFALWCWCSGGLICQILQEVKQLLWMNALFHVIYGHHSAVPGLGYFTGHGEKRSEEHF